MMIRITVDQLHIFHDKITQSTGGMKGVRDFRLVESALSKAFITFEGKDLYATIVGKIAMVTFSLIKNHGFVDGNKRMGIAVMLLLLRINGFRLKYEQTELVELGLRTAAGEFNKEQIEQWIQDHKI